MKDVKITFVNSDFLLIDELEEQEYQNLISSLYGNQSKFFELRIPFFYIHSNQPTDTVGEDYSKQHAYGSFLKENIVGILVSETI